MQNNKGNSTLYNNFKKLLDENGLLGIGRGLLYTWLNNRTIKDVSFERLDRVANQQLLNVYKDVRVENLSIIGLDHGSILLTTESQKLIAKHSPFNLKLNEYYRKAL